MNVLLYDDEREPLTAVILQDESLRREYAPISLRELLEDYTLVRETTPAGQAFLLRNSERSIDSRDLSLLVNRIKNENLKVMILKSSDISNYKMVYGLLAQTFAACAATLSPITALALGIGTMPLIEQWRLAASLNLSVPEYYYGPALHMPFSDVDVIVTEADDTLATIQARPSRDESHTMLDALRFKRQHGPKVSVLVIGDRCYSLSEEILNSDREPNLHASALQVARAFRQQFAEVVFSLEKDRHVFLFTTPDVQLIQGHRPGLVDLIRNHMKRGGLKYAV